ncbi:MAG TPA: alpha/beta hydrolase [Spongiibacteraceae bacterium]|nr:alpha/beta hydrolase [Spongiibacteraceae bacterium]
MMSITATLAAEQSKDSFAQHLSADSTIGELLDNEPARAVLARQVPAFVSSPQINQARALSLRALKVYAPTLLTDDKLLAIDAELAHTPGALIESGAPRPIAVAADFYAALQLKQIALWEGRAPDARGDGKNDMPTLTPFTTDGAVSTGTAIIVAPGGGYQGLATGHEGRQVADWFAAHGVTAFVLNYRLVSFGYRHPVQLHDAQRAIRWVRAHAGEYGIDPHRIGMIGFSAGGHLTAMASTLFDDGNTNATDPIERVSSRPDFAVLGYPAILVGKSWRDWLGLIDDKASEKIKRELDPSQNVSARTPPTFIFHTSTDELVAPANPIAYYNALRAVKVPAEMHIFEQGRHGLGFAMTDPALSVWPTLLQNWMEVHGFFGVPEAFVEKK